MLGTILSKHKKSSQGSNDGGASPVLPPLHFGGEISCCKSVPLFSYWFHDFVCKVNRLWVYFPTFKGVFGTILNVRTWTVKELDVLLGTQVVMWGLHLNPVELLICCKIAKLADLVSKERARQSACCQVSQMTNDVFFRLPFAKVEEIEKRSENTGSVMLMFCHYVIAWRATWNGRICGNEWLRTT